MNKPNPESTNQPIPLQRCKQWKEHRENKGLANEWIIAHRLGQEAFTEEQIEMIGHLFGR